MDWISDYEGGLVREVEMECIRCGHKWLADVYTEYGTANLVNDDAACCGECGGAGEE